MLDDATDYERIDMTDFADFISGGVLPVRDNRGDGSWRALKYEDLLFLLESVHERRMAFCESYPSQDKGGWPAYLAQNFMPPSSRRLDVRPVQRIYRELRELALDASAGYVWAVASFCNPDLEIPTDGSVTEASSVNAAHTFGERKAACESSDAPDIFAPPLDPQSGKYIGGALSDRTVLKGDVLRRCYWLVKRLTRVMYSETSITDTEAGPPNFGAYDLIGWSFGGATPERQSQRVSGVPMSIYSVSRSRDSNYTTSHVANFTWSRPRTVSHLKSAAAVFVLEYSHGSTNRWFAIPLRCAVQGDAIADVHMDRATADYMARRVLAAVGRPYVAEGSRPDHLEEQEGETVYLSGVSVICDLELPAEVNSAGWNWAPGVGGE